MLTNQGIFKILYSLGFRKGALLPCRPCSLTVASKKVNLVHMKNSQKTWKVGKFYNIDFHFAGDHYIQTIFTFWPSAFELLALCENPAHVWKAHEWRILKTPGLCIISQLNVTKFAFKSQWRCFFAIEEVFFFFFSPGLPCFGGHVPPLQPIFDLTSSLWVVRSSG